MKTYKVLVVAKPAISWELPEPPGKAYKFLFKGKPGPIDAVLTNLQAEDLCFIVKTNAERIDRAVVAAQVQVLGIVSMLEFLTSCAVPAVFPVAAWEFIESGVGEFVQFVSPVPIEKPPRLPLEIDSVSRLLSFLNTDDEVADRFTRGVRWYRQSLLAGNPIDRLVCLWIGFEAIESLLRFHQKTDVNLGRREWLSALQSSGQVSSVKSYDDIRQLRNGIVHGKNSLVEYLSDAEVSCEILESALVTALDDVSGLFVGRNKAAITSMGRAVCVRVNGQVSVNQRGSRDSSVPPLLDFHKGHGRILLSPAEPHVFDLGYEPEQILGSDYSISIETMAVTDAKGINPVARLRLGTSNIT